MMQQLKLAVLPVVAAVIAFGQSPVASAAPVQAIEGPRTTVVGQLNTQTFTSGLPRIAPRCLACAPASITVEWGGGFPTSQYPSSTMIVSGQHFNPGDRVEILVPGGGIWIGPNLLDTIITAAPFGPCRTSRDCTNTPGTFTFVHDFSADLAGGLHCGDQLDVAATDLTALENRNPTPWINVLTTACGM